MTLSGERWSGQKSIAIALLVLITLVAGTIELFIGLAKVPMLHIFY